MITIEAIVMKSQFILILALSLPSCGPKVVKPANVESETGCPEACEHMRTKFPECREGNDPQCVPGCEQIYNLGYIWTDDSSGPMCIVQSTTLQELRSCNVECKR